MLNLLLQHFFILKKSGKKDLINANNPNNFKIALILLIKILAIFLQIIKIQFKKPSF